MLADYHLHCEFSHDSVELMEAQIDRAIELGLDEICFTDHVDYGIKKDWSEGNIQYRHNEPMANVDYPKYFDKLHRMKELYKDKLVIKQGLEFGIQSITVDQFKKLYDTYQKELDFTLLSMHQVDNLEFWTKDFMKGRSQKEYNEKYYQEIYEVQKVFKDYSCLAHLDLLVRYDPEGIYPFEQVEAMVAEILRQAIRDNKGIELNTSSWRYGLSDTQPSKAILKLYKDLGGKIITIGSDAHKTSQLGDHIKEGQLILKELGYEEFCTFDQMNPIFHKL